MDTLVLTWRRCDAQRKTSRGSCRLTWRGKWTWWSQHSPGTRVRDKNDWVQSNFGTRNSTVMSIIPDSIIFLISVTFKIHALHSVVVCWITCVCTCACIHVCVCVGGMGGREGWRREENSQAVRSFRATTACSWSSPMLCAPCAVSVDIEYWSTNLQSCFQWQKHTSIYHKTACHTGG